MFSKDMYGGVWRMDRLPWHLEKPPLDQPTFDGYDFPSHDKFTNQIYRDKAEAVKNYQNDDEHYRVIGMGWGIFETSWRLRGFENALMDTRLEPEFYAEVAEKIADAYVAMLQACADIPADAYLFGDDWGDQRGVMMGHQSWRKFVKPNLARIYDEVHRQGKKVLQHCCGSIVDIYDDLAEIGMDCHESVQPEARGMEPSAIKARWGGKISFWGCLGSQGLLAHGSPSEIRAEIIRLNNLFKQDGGYILAPAKSLSDDMPLDKAVAVIDALSELNA